MIKEDKITIGSIKSKGKEDRIKIDSIKSKGKET